MEGKRLIKQMYYSFQKKMLYGDLNSTNSILFIMLILMNGEVGGGVYMTLSL